MLVAFLTPVLGGILLGCCFLPAPAFWLVWIGLVPIAATIARRGHVVATYLGMYCAGLVFNLITTDWIRTLDGGVGLSGQRAPDWLLQSQLLAMFWPVTLWLGRVLVTNWRLPMSLVLPIVWIVHEFLLRNVWALVDQTGWQVYHLGYATVDHRHLSQIADLGGVSALSLLVAATSGATWDLLAMRWQHTEKQPSTFWRLTGVAAVVSLLALSNLYGLWAIHRTQLADGPNVWLMPERDLREPPIERPWKPKTPGAPDVLLWSELAYHGPPANASQSAVAWSAGASGTLGTPTAARVGEVPTEQDAGLEYLGRTFDVPLVVGYTRTERREAPEKRYNSAAFVDPKFGLQGRYDKVGLVPWTEFTPLEGLASQPGLKFSHGVSYPVFRLRTARTQEVFHFATAICYDIAFPRIFRRYMQSASGPPDFFLICSSERADGTGQMSRHVLNLARIRAIECRRSIVRNVHLGPSGRIDSTGRLHDFSIPPSLESPVPLGKIAIDRRRTLYVVWGDWIPTVIGCILLTAAAQKLASRRAGRSSSGHDCSELDGPGATAVV